MESVNRFRNNLLSVSAYTHYSNSHAALKVLSAHSPLTLKDCRWLYKKVRSLYLLDQTNTWQGEGWNTLVTQVLRGESWKSDTPDTQLPIATIPCQSFRQSCHRRERSILPETITVITTLKHLDWIGSYSCGQILATLC